MILTDKIVIKMLREIRDKIINKQEINDKERNLITTLIMYTIADLGGEIVNDSSGREKEA